MLVTGAMLAIAALWLAQFGIMVTSSNAAWQENIRPKMYVQLGECSNIFTV
jgi:hypothetical protein